MTALSVHLVSGPLAPQAQVLVPGAGAVLEFLGVVRPQEAERPIVGLLYETYDPMTERELRRLAEQTLTRYGLSGICVEHSRELVPVGSVSFRLRVASPHRQPAIQAIDAFINTMKQDVPIWKVPVWSERADHNTAGQHE